MWHSPLHWMMGHGTTPPADTTTKFLSLNLRLQSRAIGQIEWRRSNQQPHLHFVEPKGVADGLRIRLINSLFPFFVDDGVVNFIPNPEILRM